MEFYMKSVAVGLSLSALFTLASLNTAHAGPSGIPEYCSVYIPECSCNVNPYNVTCGSAGWGGATDLRDDQVPPDPTITYNHVLKSRSNPYTATCWSSSIDRFNYAYWAITRQMGSTDVASWWGHNTFFVIYSDNTLSEAYVQSMDWPDIYQEPYMETCGRPPLPEQLIYTNP